MSSCGLAEIKQVAGAESVPSIMPTWSCTDQSPATSTSRVVLGMLGSAKVPCAPAGASATVHRYVNPPPSGSVLVSPDSGRTATGATDAGHAWSGSVPGSPQVISASGYSCVLPPLPT